MDGIRRGIKGGRGIKGSVSDLKNEVRNGVILLYTIRVSKVMK